jgi:hypothetical protein
VHDVDAQFVVDSGTNVTHPARAGDLDGDGLDDAFVAAVYGEAMYGFVASANGSVALGSAFCTLIADDYSGNIDALNATDLDADGHPDALLDVGSDLWVIRGPLVGTVLRTESGNTIPGYAESSIQTADLDLDADGERELGVAWPGRDSPEENAGAIFIIPQTFL